MRVRLRFSLRWLFVAFTFLAVALYLSVIRPTLLAHKFVSAVSRQDFSEAKNLMVSSVRWSRIVDQKNLPDPDHIFADLLPWDWRDVLHARRRIVLRIARHNDYRGAHVEWTEDSDVVATALGLRAELTGRADYNWPATRMPSESTIKNPEEVMRLEPNLRSG
jgi:hypothetical protein